MAIKTQPEDHLVVPDLLKLNRILAHRRLWPLLVVAAMLLTGMIYFLNRAPVPQVIAPTTSQTQEAPLN